MVKTDDFMFYLEDDISLPESDMLYQQDGLLFIKRIKTQTQTKMFYLDGSKIITDYGEIEVVDFSRVGYPFPVSSKCFTNFVWQGKVVDVARDRIVYEGTFQEWRRGDIARCPSIANEYSQVAYSIYNIFFQFLPSIPFLLKVGIEVKIIEERIVALYCRNKKIARSPSYQFIGGWREEWAK